MNDYRDRHEDAVDPKKQHRPLASGKVSPGQALLLMLILISFGVSSGAYLGIKALSVFIFYFIMNVFYSFLGKRIILVDVFIISTGYILRVLVGAYALDVEASPWILSTTFFIALFLGFFKRYYEVVTGSPEELIGGVYDPETLKMFTSITASLSLVNYSIYTVLGPHAKANLVWTVPLVVLGIFRYYVLLQSPEKLKDGNPSDLLLADKFLILNIFAWLLLCAVLIVSTGS